MHELASRYARYARSELDAGVSEDSVLSMEAFAARHGLDAAKMALAKQAMDCHENSLDATVNARTSRQARSLLADVKNVACLLFMSGAVIVSRDAMIRARTSRQARLCKGKCWRSVL